MQYIVDDFNRQAIDAYTNRRLETLVLMVSRRLIHNEVNICLRLFKMHELTLPIQIPQPRHGSRSFPAPTEADPPL